MKISVKGSSLFYSIVISLLIGLFAGFLILFFYYKRIASDDLLVRDQLIRNTESGINLLMNSEKFNYDQSYTEDLFSEKCDSVVLKKEKWGFFDLLFCEAKKGSRTEHLFVMVGMGKRKAKNTALYITDYDRPLTVSGKTLLIGDVYLPKAGIEKGYVNGNSFIGDEPVHGATKISENHFLELDDLSIKPIFKLLYENNFMEGFISTSLDSDSLVCSFQNGGISINSADAIHIKGQFIKGKVFIKSKKRIVVYKEAQLEDVVLVAPVIEFKEEFRGKLQAFARDSILCGKESVFYYPSVLALMQNNDSACADNGVLILDEKVQVNGELIGLKSDLNMNKQVLISLESGCIINGNIICNGLVNLTGKIYGSVFANKLILKTTSAIYENNLSDTEIDVGKLPAGFGGCPIFKKEYRKTIIRYIN